LVNTRAISELQMPAALTLIIAQPSGHFGMFISS